MKVCKFDVNWFLLIFFVISGDKIELFFFNFKIMGNLVS